MAIETDKVVKSLVALLLIIAIEPLYREPWYEWSLDWIVDVQDGATEGAKSFWNVYTEVGLYGSIAGPIAYVLAFNRDRERPVYYCLAALIASILTNLGKLLYADPRPFWSSDDIEAFYCSSQYGNPSGHSIFPWCMAMLIALDYTESSATDSTTSVLIKTSALLFGYSVSYSRVFLGVHSLNQIFFGAQLGLWTAFTMHYVIRESFMYHLKELTSLGASNWLRHAARVIAFMVFVYAVLMGNYWAFKPSNLPEWSVRIEAQCGAEELEEAFEKHSVLDFG